MSSPARHSSPDRLTIELENPSLAVRLLGLGAGTQQWQFVGKVDGHAVFTSATFGAPFSWGGIPIGRTISPEEEWAPGMKRALDELRREIEDAGWAEIARGRQPWEIQYQKT